MYRAKLAHIASADNEPEVGASTETYWELWSAGGANGDGSGDVVGPDGATQNNICVFADSSGKFVEDSGVHISTIDFIGLTESTSDLEPEDDYVKVYKGSLEAYRKVPVGKFERKTQTISISPKSMWPRSTNSPCDAAALKTLSTTKRDTWVMPFSSTSKTYAQCEFIMPESWDGSALRALFYGRTPTATSGSVLFGISARCVSDGDSEDVADGTGRETTLTTHDAANKEIISSQTGAITPSGTCIGGSRILLTVYRDPTKTSYDTLDEDFYLTGVLIRYGVRDD